MSGLIDSGRDWTWPSAKQNRTTPVCRLPNFHPVSRGLVVSGKFRPAALREADPQPDAVVDSLADLPAYLNGA